MNTISKCNRISSVILEVYNRLYELGISTKKYQFN